MARRDDGDSAELVHERMGPRTSRRDRRDSAIRQVRRIAGHVHRVTSISLLPRENPKSLRTPADETAESIRRAQRAKPYSRSRLACTRGIALMEFRNERTWQNAADLGKTEEFHLNYEAAVDKVRAEFGGKHPIIIDGKEVWSKATFPDTSPADTSLVLGLFQKGTRSHAKQAIKAAKAAFPTWSATPYLERVRTIQRAADRISERKYAHAALLSFENGKNRSEAMADVDEAADLLRWYAAEMIRNQGYEHTMGQFLPGESARAMLKPYGVWAVVAPVNFPFAIAAGMSAGGPITGETGRVKAPSRHPLLVLQICVIVPDAALAP